MRRLKILQAIACEYLARGENNKHTLVNTYAGDILVKAFPANFPLAFYIEMDVSKDTPAEVKIAVYVGKKLRAELAATLQPPAASPAVFALPALLLEFQKATEIRVIAKAEGYADTIVMRKSVSESEQVDR